MLDSVYLVQSIREDAESWRSFHIQAADLNGDDARLVREGFAAYAFEILLEALESYPIPDSLQSLEGVTQMIQANEISAPVARELLPRIFHDSMTNNLLQERREQLLVARVASGELSELALAREILPMQRVDEVVANAMYDGLGRSLAWMKDGHLLDWPVVSVVTGVDVLLEYVDPVRYRPDDYAQIVAMGLTAACFQLPVTAEGQVKQFDRTHVTLGHAVGPKFVPMVTILGNECYQLPEAV